MKLPDFPEFSPITLEMKKFLHPGLNLIADGVSEFTFSNLFLFRRRYNYMVSKVSGKNIVISGGHDETKFFMNPYGIPGVGVLEQLFDTHDYWKGLSDSVLCPNRSDIENLGVRIAEDRDNFDYLYLKTDLADLSGRKYHKKRNLVNSFTNSYKFQERSLTKELVPQAMTVLESWRESKGEDGDLVAAKEALELFNELNMQGVLYYVDDKPAGWCLGEGLANGKMFAVHFEKGIDSYKGIYQFINQAFAAALPKHYIYINREQDLGDKGLRQAKMTYRPVDFVRKYVARFPSPGLLATA